MVLGPRRERAGDDIQEVEGHGEAGGNGRERERGHEGA